MTGPDTPQNPPGWSTPQPGWQQPPGQGYPPQQPPTYPPQQPPGYPQPGQGYPPQQPPGYPQPGQGYPPQQPPGYPQPGMYGAPQPGSPFPPAATAPKKRSGLKTALLVLLVLFVLGLGGCGAFVFFVAKTAGAPVDTANKWLDALEDERSSAELEALSCPGLFDQLDQVREELAVRGWTGGQNLNGSSIVNGDATVTGTLDYGTTDVGVTIELQKSGGEWCVFSIETDS